MTQLKSLFIDYYLALPLGAHLLILLILACWVMAILSMDQPITLIIAVGTITAIRIFMAQAFAVGFFPFILWMMLITGVFTICIRFYILEKKPDMSHRHYFNR